MSERLSVKQQALYAVANHALTEHNTNISLGMLMMQPPGGILVVYIWRRQRGGRTELHICEPQKIHKPEILHPKELPGIKISYPKKTT